VEKEEISVMNGCITLGFYCILVRYISLEQYRPISVMRLLLELLRDDQPFFFLVLMHIIDTDSNYE